MFTKLCQKEAISIRESTKETRELILKSARDIFLETGYQDASMRKIAARAGITAGAIYKHFSGKEEMFGALMQSLKRAKRIIFVGDPNQLPPIGAGRPFVDLVYMVKMNLKPGFPRVCDHYGELTVNRRQKADEVRMDVRLSRLFTSTEERLDDDVITDILRDGNVSSPSEI